MWLPLRRFQMARVNTSNQANRVTTTTTASWQCECLAWAKNREPFEVRGIRHRHLLFFQELSAAYKLKFQYSMGESAMTFEPN